MTENDGDYKDASNPDVRELKPEIGRMVVHDQDEAERVEQPDRKTCECQVAQHENDRLGGWSTSFRGGGHDDPRRNVRPRRII